MTFHNHSNWVSTCFQWSKTRTLQESPRLLQDPFMPLFLTHAHTTIVFISLVYTALLFPSFSPCEILCYFMGVMAKSTSTIALHHPLHLQLCIWLFLQRKKAFTHACYVCQNKPELCSSDGDQSSYEHEVLLSHCGQSSYEHKVLLPPQQQAWVKYSILSHTRSVGPWSSHSLYFTTNSHWSWKEHFLGHLGK